MKKQQSGFTLIELIAVIVILGILAAVAVPKFVDLSDSAQHASAKATAGALGSAAALNHAGATAVKAGLAAPTPAPITIATCADVVKLLEGSVLPEGIVISNETESATAEGVVCNVALESDATGDPARGTFTAWSYTYTAPTI